MKPIDYAAPATVDEAVEILAAGNGRARPLAGGTDLVAQLREGRRHYATLVDLKRIPDLLRITYSPEEGLYLGAAATCMDIARHPEVARRYPAIQVACSMIGSVLIQNRATLGGNLGNAAPSADGVPPLIVYGAVAVIAGPAGLRRVPVEDVCTGPGTTCLAPGEFVVAFHVPTPPPHSGAHYLRFIPRNEMDIAVAGAGAAVTLDASGQHFESVRIALAAVAPTPIRARDAEAYLAGKTVDERHLFQAGELASAASRPISDVRGSAAYRRHLVSVLTRRALAASVQLARGGGTARAAG